MAPGPRIWCWAASKNSERTETAPRRRCLSRERTHGEPVARDENQDPQVVAGDRSEHPPERPREDRVQDVPAGVKVDVLAPRIEQEIGVAEALARLAWIRCRNAGYRAGSVLFEEAAGEGVTEPSILITIEKGLGWTDQMLGDLVAAEAQALTSPSTNPRFPRCAPARLAPPSCPGASRKSPCSPTVPITT